MHLPTPRGLLSTWQEALMYCTIQCESEEDERFIEEAKRDGYDFASIMEKAMRIIMRRIQLGQEVKMNDK